MVGTVAPNAEQILLSERINEAYNMMRQVASKIYLRCTLKVQNFLNVFTRKNSQHTAK